MKKRTYVQRATITIDEYTLVKEEESVDVPSGYDEGGDPPLLRLAIQHNGKVFVCYSLKEFATAVAKTGFPVSTFCSLNPSELARMITSVERMSRPIQNHPFFDFLESDGRFKLEEIEPRFENEMLVWHELQKGAAWDVRRRSLSASTLKLDES